MIALVVVVGIWGFNETQSSEYHIDRARILDLSLDKKQQFPFSSFALGDVKHFCSFGPYQFGPAHPGGPALGIKQGENFEALQELADTHYFPIADNYGLLLFFDHEKKFLGAEYLSQYKHRIRWKRPENEDDEAACGAIDIVSVLIEPEGRVQYLTFEFQK